jgi:hypothetical protein
VLLQDGCHPVDGEGSVVKMRMYSFMVLRSKKVLFFQCVQIFLKDTPEVV